MAALHGDPNMQAILAKIIELLTPETVIETGTFHGDSSRWFAERVPAVLTCEIRDDFAGSAEANATAHGVTNIYQRRGSSLTHLPGMLTVARELGGCSLVFLDAHWQDEWPLVGELEMAKHARDTLFNGWMVVVVDDFQVPGRTNFSAPEGGGGTIGHDVYGPRLMLDKTPANLGTFGDQMREWPEVWFPDYDGEWAGYAILSGKPLGLEGLPVRRHVWEE